MKPMAGNDSSNGYEASAAAFIARREHSTIGVATVSEWAQALPPRASILDIGCGPGVPISSTLMSDGFVLYGVDSSPSMIRAFRSRFPEVRVACEAVEESAFFGRTFDGVVAVGLMFLLSPDAQRDLIRRIARVLNSGGHFLFTAPAQVCTWKDVLTGRVSTSLGAEAYRTTLSESGLEVVAEHVDEGGNHYYAAHKQ